MVCSEKNKSNEHNSKLKFLTYETENAYVDITTVEQVNYNRKNKDQVNQKLNVYAVFSPNRMRSLENTIKLKRNTL